ncbi:hypothetical protein PCCS19_13270 [Paenibacillus sp. CCS19]|uniref:class I SAM-dependent methyltransferase n=1 Tax=Paenibacillus sp. CCS19 TaxID=3158387 RepID=UPI002566C2AD|nr:class I SAM-dependent methyltransferase [Paenibacillus cellulosilyticus]GMK38273.1 hypothetical protein PCCS19_13270 [Paenibacillus cellulosilyticus]
MNLIQEAEILLATDERAALKKYMQSIEFEPDFAPMACFRIGEISNRMGEALNSFQYHEMAYKLNPGFSEVIVQPEHPSYVYVYKEPVEHKVTKCPLCGSGGAPYAAFNVTTSIDFLHGFHPVRLWMACDDCHHLFAHNYPVQLNDILSNSAFEFNLKPKPHLFPLLSSIVMNITNLAPGRKLLEVGVGAGEFSAVAKEFLFDVTGLDIRSAYAKAVSEMLDIPVYTSDFDAFESVDGYDVIVMGDVIEHMADPLRALRKAHSLLNDNGVLWISTPNFESAFSMVSKDKDPMWRIVEHLNYFSYRSLGLWLNRIGFEVVNYSVSSHYNGSMEVTAIKR